MSVDIEEMRWAGAVCQVERESANGSRVTLRIPFWPGALKEKERGLGVKNWAYSKTPRSEVGQWGFPELKSPLRKVLQLIRLVWFIGHSILSYWLGTVHGKYGFGTKMIMDPEKVAAGTHARPLSTCFPGCCTRSSVGITNSKGLTKK